MKTSLLAALALPIAIAAAPAVAAPIRPYSAAGVQAAQRAGQPVLIDVHADWCPTCRTQAPIVAELSRDRAYANLQIFILDFDKQKAERRALRVNAQSTLIAYKGTAERSRATGIVDRNSIRLLAATALR